MMNLDGIQMFNALNSLVVNMQLISFGEAARLKAEDSLLNLVSWES